MGCPSGLAMRFVAVQIFHLAAHAGLNTHPRAGPTPNRNLPTQRGTGERVRSVAAASPPEADLNRESTSVLQDNNSHVRTVTTTFDQPMRATPGHPHQQ